jgi:alpha-L-fucosidase
MTALEFSELRYGMFVHYGLFSNFARGEWVMNREQIPPEEMCRLAQEFDPSAFDADFICQLAVDGGMKYIILTTMHHEGFRLYDTALTDFNAAKICGRDLVAELVDAARRHGLKIGLYHSLNNWSDQPDSVAALEDKEAYEKFISNTFARLEELVKKFAPFDILWYDGWWPFNSEGWQAVRMNETMRKIQPHLLFNGRNGLPGDFGTPEQHLTAPSPWRPWEACVTLNDHWGFHRNDTNWKTPVEVIKMLLTCGAGRGNLLLNIGPRGDGSVPEASASIIRTVGTWLKNGGQEAIAACEPMPLSPTIPQPGDRGDWDSQGSFTASGNTLFMTLLYSPGDTLTLTGVRAAVQSVTACNGKYTLSFRQEGEKLSVGLPQELFSYTAPVLKFICDRPPVIYRTGGMRTPECPHPRYDPVQPDILY